MSMESACPECGMMFGAHAPNCSQHANPFGKIDRAMAPTKEAEDARAREVARARGMLRTADAAQREMAAQERRMGSNPDLEQMSPEERWREIGNSLERKIERLALDMHDKSAEEKVTLLQRFKGMTELLESIKQAQADGRITEKEEAELMDNPAVAYAFKGDLLEEQVLSNLQVDREKLALGSQKLAGALQKYDKTQTVVERAQAKTKLTESERQALDMSLEQRLDQASGFIERQRQAEDEARKLDGWLEGRPSESGIEELDALPLAEAIRRLSSFKDEVDRVENMPEKTGEEKETKRLERQRLIVWRDALLKRMALPEINTRLWDVADGAREMEKSGLLNFDEKEKRRMDILDLAKHVYQHDLTQEVVKRFEGAKGNVAFSEDEAKILLSVFAGGKFLIDPIIDEATYEFIQKDGYRDKNRFSTEFLLQYFLELKIQPYQGVWDGISKYFRKPWAKSMLEALVTMNFFAKAQPLEREVEGRFSNNGKSMTRYTTWNLADQRHVGIAFAALTKNDKYDWRIRQSMQESDRDMFRRYQAVSNFNGSVKTERSEAA